MRRVWIGALLSLVACQILIDGDVGPVRCLDEGAIGAPACPTGLTCMAGLCTMAPPGGLGRVCLDDAGCEAGDLCLDPALFGGEATCSRPCCSSSDCGPPGSGFVCGSPAASGANVCQPAAALGRPSGGALRVGTACATNEACRSGVCDGALCADTCCVDATCTAAAQGCVFGTTPVVQDEGWACGPASETSGKLLDPCINDADCASGLCVPLGLAMVCSAPCCESSTCGPASLDGVPGVLACAEQPHGTSVARACSRWLPETATAAIGAACTGDDECRGGRCIDAPGGGETKRVCSDTCCTDASCGDPAAFACRPYASGESWALRCEPR